MYIYIYMCVCVRVCVYVCVCVRNFYGYMLLACTKNSWRSFTLQNLTTGTLRTSLLCSLSGIKKKGGLLKIWFSKNCKVTFVSYDFITYDKTFYSTLIDLINVVKRLSQISQSREAVFNFFFWQRGTLKNFLNS